MFLDRWEFLLFFVSEYISSLRTYVKLHLSDETVAWLLCLCMLQKLNWSSRGSGVVRDYKAFILNLVSSHTFYLRACLRMIITQFRPSKSQPLLGFSGSLLPPPPQQTLYCLHMMLSVIILQVYCFYSFSIFM